MIRLLSKETIDKIAAGEVIDRPESVVRELLDNAIDSGAGKISLEIRAGGTELIRVTDDGCGIDKEDIRTAFLRHATSKLVDAGDLEHIRTMGFRGEALASIAAVSRTEVITKTRDSMTGFRYQISGGVEGELSEVGIPEGTTMLVRDLFYNVPARKAFLRSAQTEAAYVTDTAEKAALSHPHIAFTYISDGRTIFHTTGSGRLSEVIYTIYGRELSRSLLEVSEEVPEAGISISGYIGKPVIARSRRDLEICFVNGRYIRSELLRKAIEDGYEGYMMLHRFPFTMLSLDIDPGLIDVNVHPKKMEVRFSDEQAVYRAVTEAVRNRLHREELVVDASIYAPRAAARTEASGDNKGERIGDEAEKPVSSRTHVEPFEIRRAAAMPVAVPSGFQEPLEPYPKPQIPSEAATASAGEPQGEFLQQELPREIFLSEKALPQFRMIGQVFETYWIIEYDGAMYLIDQHAAHEKVNYERLLRELRDKSISSQYIMPPVLLELSANEAELVGSSLEVFSELGFEVEPAGGRDFVVRAVPADLPELSRKELLMEMVDSLSSEGGTRTPDILRDKLASMACKAAVKGNNRLSEQEMKELIGELISLDNPYACPHGRPTIVKWSRYELDRMFKRVI